MAPIIDDYSDSEILAAAPAAPNALLDTPETSVDMVPTIEDNGSYQSKRRLADSVEWQLSIETLIAMQPVVTGRRIERFIHCREHAYFFRNRDSGSVHVFSSACRDRGCPFCADARSREVSEQITEWIAGARNPRFLTLTLRSSNAPLPVQIDNIYQAFRRLRLQPSMRDYLRSGVWFFQVTFNHQTQQWHPHLHCVIVGKWLSKRKWSAAWKLASRGSYIVDIQPIKDPVTVAEYVARYSARPYRLKGLDLERRKECMWAFMSRRLFGTWGPKPERPRVSRPKLDMGKWEPIGSWSYIMWASSHDARARAILEAYKLRKPLEPGLSCREYDLAAEREWITEIDCPGSDWPEAPPGRENDNGNKSGNDHKRRHKNNVDVEPILPGLF